WVQAALASTQRQLAPQHTEELRRLQKQRDAIEPRISRFLDMASELEQPKPILRKIDELERERDRLEGMIAQLALADEASAALATVSEAKVIAMFGRLAQDRQQLPRDNLKDLLSPMLDRIVLDAQRDTVQLHYRIPFCRDKGAPPGGFDPRLPP